MVVKKAAKSEKGEPDLKGKNPLYLWSFVAVNSAVFLSVIVNKGLPQSLQPLTQTWSQVSAKNGIIAVCIPIAVIVLSGVISDTMKVRLVFWRWRDPLPGCRAFSALMESDPRINGKVLAAKHGKFPRTPSAQNALWYRIYREHKLKRMIWSAQQVFLLTRDLTAIAACFAVLFSAGAALARVDWKTWLGYTAVLILQYIVVARAARNYGISFVLDVLSEECATCGTV
jgi:hypothetical protein